MQLVDSKLIKGERELSQRVRNNIITELYYERNMYEYEELEGIAFEFLTDSDLMNYRNEWLTDWSMFSDDNFEDKELKAHIYYLKNNLFEDWEDVHEILGVEKF